MAALSEAEINVWAEYRSRNGFPVDRLAIGTANAGAYVGAVSGGKAKVGDLLARFKRPAESRSLDGIKAWFGQRAAKGTGE